MTALLFIEDREEARAAFTLTRDDKRLQTVAITAEAMDAADALGLPCRAIADFATTYALAEADQAFNIATAALADRLDAYLAAHAPEARLEGPGPVAGQVYFIQYAVSAVAKRAYLMREAVQALQPDRTITFARDVDPWFRGDGYSESPWMIALADSLASWRARHQVLPRPRTSSGTPLGRRARRVAGAVSRRLRAVADDLTMRKTAAQTIPPELKDSTILFVGRFLYDWTPVAEALASSCDCWFASGAYLDPARPWSLYYLPRVERWPRGRARTFSAPSPEPDAQRRHELRQLIHRYLEDHAAGLKFDVLGIDLWRALTPHLAELTSASVALAAYNDAVARLILDDVRPDVICFPATANLADKRLVHEARTRHVPVLCYQHGFGYGVQIQSKDEQIETSDVDYFFTYGPGIQPRAESPFPARARYVPIGSTRIERFRRQRSRRPAGKTVRDLNILWVAESSTRNTLVTSVTEDTHRYLLEREGLTILAGCGAQIIFRPYIHAMEYDGVTQWLARSGLRRIRVNVVTPLMDLISQSHLVVMNTSSPTSWAEVIGAGRPMILFCDPRQTLLVPSFEPKLERACRWCKNADELLAALRELAANPIGAIASQARRDTREFEADYILGDGRCLQHALQAMADAMG